MDEQQQEMLGMMNEQETRELLQRRGLNAEEAALVTMVFKKERDQANKKLLRYLNATTREALEMLYSHFESVPDDMLDELLATWIEQDGLHHDTLARLANMTEEQVRRHKAHLDGRWGRVIDLATYRQDPLAPTLPAQHNLDVAARIIVEDLNLEYEREDLLPAQEGEGDPASSSFDLAHFYEWSPEELVDFARRLGYMLFACSLRNKDRRAMARQLYALSAEPRAWVTRDIKLQTSFAPELTKRVDEVLIALGKRADASLDQRVTSLGFYILAVAAGRRLAKRALKIAARLPHPHGLDMHRFVEQHSTSSRKGLEPLAVQAIEALVERLAAPSSDISLTGEPL